MSALSPEFLEWIWSYRQVFKWFDEFDAAALKLNPAEWDGDTQLKFLTTYGLTRGVAHQSLQSNFTRIVDKLHALFGNRLDEGNALNDLNNRWSEGINVVRDIQNGRDLKSFTSKLLWFYQPKHMTMFDEFARCGLRKWKLSQTAKGALNVNEKNFLELFDDFYLGSASWIEAAARYCDRSYPYPRRIADQWLWLNGSKRCFAPTLPLAS